MKTLLIATLIFAANPAMASHYETFYANPAFWVAVSFVLVVGLLFKTVKKTVASILFGRINNILDKIQSASGLRNDAQKLLKSYQEKQKNVKTETNQMLKEAKEQIAYLQKTSFEKIDEELSLKQKDMAAKINVMENNAKAEIFDIITRKTIEKIDTHMQTKQDAKTQENLVDKAIENL